MATLEKIRSRAALTIGVIGVALVAFIVGDALNSGSSFFRQSQQEIATVDGEVLGITQYQQMIDEMTEVYKLQSGQSNLPAEYYPQIQQSVWDTFVRSTIYTNQAKAIGMTVTSEELFDNITGANPNQMIQQMPMFQNPQTRRFDKTILLNFLRTIENPPAEIAEEGRAQIALYKKFWLFWEHTIREQILEQKYGALLIKAMSVSTLDAKHAFEGNKHQVDFIFAGQSYSTISDSLVKLTDSEIKARYEQIKSRYKQEENRQVSYIAVDIRPSESDYAKAKTQIDKLMPMMESAEEYLDAVARNSDEPFYDGYQPLRNFQGKLQEFLATAASDQVYGPYFEAETYKAYRFIGRTTQADSVKASQIFIPKGDEKMVAKQVDSLYALVKNGGDFAAIATTGSQDRTAENGGDMGWFTEQAAVQGIGKEFAATCFATPVGQTAIVKSNYGTHIIKITQRTAPITKVKFAALEIKVTPDQQTISELYNNLNRLVSDIDVKTMEQEAQQKGYVVQKNDKVTAADYNFGGLKDSRAIIRWIFSADKGDISEIFEVNNQFILVALNDISPKGFQPLASIENIVKSDLIAKKKGAMIADQWKAKSFSSVATAAQSLGSMVDTAKFVTFNTRRLATIGDEPAVVAAAVTAQSGAFVSPIVGKNGVYAIQVIGQSQNPGEFNAQMQKSMLASNLIYRFRYQAFDILKDKAEIEDNRIRFY